MCQNCVLHKHGVKGGAGSGNFGHVTRSSAYARKSWLRQATIDLWLKAERHAEADIQDAAMFFLSSQRAEVAKQLRRIENEKPAILADEHAADRIINEAFDPRDWDEDLRATMGPAIARTIVRGYLSSRAIQAGRRRRFPPVWRKGGAGSGNFGHAGRPGMVGGSTPDEDDGGGIAVADEQYTGNDAPGAGERARVPIDELEFPGGFGDEVTPLHDNRQMPIIVQETYTGWRVIDGWGRASGMQNAGEEEIHVIIVTEGDIAERSGAGDDADWVAAMYARYAPNLDPPISTNAYVPLRTKTKPSFLTKRADDKPNPRRPVNPSAGRGGWADMPLTEAEIAEVLSFELPPNVTRSVFKHTTEIMDKPYWKDMNDTAKDRMKWSIQEGVEEGKTLRQIAGDIQGDIGSDEVRAQRIATTELTGSLNAGHVVNGEEAEEAGVTIVKTWVTIGDDKVRPDHEESDGQVVEGSAGLFDVGGEQAPYPGFADLSADNRINCRCLAQIDILEQAEKSAYVQRNGKWFDVVYVELARSKGGAGSGNFGHGGRPGEVGGSAPNSASETTSGITASSTTIYYQQTYERNLQRAALASDPEVRERFSAAAKDIFAVLPPGAAVAIISDFEFARNSQELSNVWERYSPQTVNKGIDTIGVYFQDKNTIALSASTSDISGTLAHEIAHAVDHGGSREARISTSDEWKRAWREDIEQAPEDLVLSEYSKKSPSEGFAEFARFAWNPKEAMSQVGGSGLRDGWPLAYAVFEKHNLIPKGLLQ